MAIQFITEDKVARFLNPFTNFEESEAKCQLRWDPLTHRSGRLAHFVGFKPPPADLSKIIEDSAENCPFCPDKVNAITPKFSPEQIPEGRLEKGESVVFPNLLPYDEHSALTVLCRDHYKSLEDFTPMILTDALKNSAAYLDRVVPYKDDIYGLITWNYLPAAGSSQVHPHFQVYATSVPGNFLQTVLDASKDYYQTKACIYWEDYIEAEINAGERLIKEAAHSVWLTDFVSLSALTDIIAIFPNRQTVFDLTETEWAETAKILDSVLKYLGSQGVYSLNMAWMPALSGRADYWLQLRISPRMYMAPHVWCTETPSLVYQYQESFMVWSPEDTAKEMRGAV
ncbi:MAG: hypothetical protein U5L07_12110 [Desulfobacterales bacterium]|nr:hypothetical protein [Desulfobacterales bacterium]